ncbi:MAG: NCS2 family permease [Bacteroidales bacterium]|nr:NCS2 family permease [Bacteroidales bacterium]
MIDNYFQLKENKTDVKTEILVGITTFIAGMYIIVVNPTILKDAGIPYDSGITATILLSAFMTIAMGLYAKNPILVAPGMGINAYFTYTVVIGMGISPYVALGAIFWAGVFFVVISALNIRTYIIQAIPMSVRIGGAVGIGIYIALIGFHNSGFIIAKAPFIGLGKLSSNTFIFLLGLSATIILVQKKVKGALILGMIVTTLLSWPVGRWFAIEPHATPLIEWNGAFAAPDFSWFFKADLIKSLHYSFIPILFALLFVDMFDSITTFVGVAEATGLKEKNGDPRNIKQSMIVDGLATLFAGLFGTTSGTAYIESTAGIEAGGRTGLAAVVTGLLFLPFLFFAPLASLVPQVATAPVLVLVGVFMAAPLSKINWHQMEEAIPAFLTLVLIPLTYSLTQGIVYGLLTYTLIKIVNGKSREIPWMLWVVDAFSILMLSIEYRIV